MARNRMALALIASMGAWLVSAFLALYLGAVDDAGWELILQLRLPRLLLASAVGAGLAVAGTALQALFANPLCEPYTLGISSGSALGAVIGITLGIQSSAFGLSVPAFLGAMAFSAFLSVIAMRPGVGNLTLLLAGVMLGFLGSSLVALWMATADPNGVQAAIFWLLGDLSRARHEGAAISLGAVLLLTIFLWSRWRSLDALLMGEEGAMSLGISVASVRRQLLFSSSILVGLCVSGAGMIGCVGLVVPHFARRWIGSLHRRLIPIAAIWGAVTLTAADAISRYALRPYELPVGVVTALAGAPLFLWAMLQRRDLG